MPSQHALLGTVQSAVFKPDMFLSRAPCSYCQHPDQKGAPCYRQGHIQELHEGSVCCEPLGGHQNSRGQVPRTADLLPPALVLYTNLLSACDRGQTLGICFLLSSLKPSQPQLQPWLSLDQSTTLSGVAGAWRKNFPTSPHCGGQEPGTTLNLVWVAQSKTPPTTLKVFPRGFH